MQQIATAVAASAQRAHIWAAAPALRGAATLPLRKSGMSDAMEKVEVEHLSDWQQHSPGVGASAEHDTVVESWQQQ